MRAEWKTGRMQKGKFAKERTKLEEEIQRMWEVWLI
jgi:hypothetical protein